DEMRRQTASEGEAGPAGFLGVEALVLVVTRGTQAEVARVLAQGISDAGVEVERSSFSDQDSGDGAARSRGSVESPRLEAIVLAQEGIVKEPDSSPHAGQVAGPELHRESIGKVARSEETAHGLDHMVAFEGSIGHPGHVPGGAEGELRDSIRDQQRILPER